MSKNCHDCGAKPREFHKPGCDVERCPFCGGQLITCDCAYKVLGPEFGWQFDRSKPLLGLPSRVYLDGLTEEMGQRWEEMLDKEGRIPWSGEWPGEAEAIRLGFFCYFDGGWKRCEKDHPKAEPDLNRLYAECRWDRKLKQFVLKQGA